MLINKNIIKELTPLYAGFSFYYSDFLKLHETIFDYNKGLSEKSYFEIRVVNKKSLGTYGGNEISDIKTALKKAVLNSDVRDIMPEKTYRLNYPYIHTYKNRLFDLNPKNIRALNFKIKKFEKIFRPDNLEFSVKKTAKLFISNIGSIIEQEHIIVKYTILKSGRLFFNHYKINSIDEINLPSLKFKDIENLEKYPLLFSSYATAKLIFELYEKGLLPQNIKFKTAPYLYKGINSNLYDDEGTLRTYKDFKGVKGGDIFSKNHDCGYFYDFKKNKKILKMPDLEMNAGNMNLYTLKENTYLLLNNFKEVSFKDKSIIIESDISLYEKGEEKGFALKKIKFEISELKKNKNFTKVKKVTGLENFSVKVPYLYLGGRYEFL